MTFTASPFTDICVVRMPATVEKTGGSAPFPTFKRNALPFSALMYHSPDSQAQALELAMISYALVAALMFMGPPSGSTAASRNAYSQCINAFVKKSLADKLDSQAFGAAVASACQAEAAAFRNAVVAKATTDGFKKAEAEQMGKDEVLDYQINATEMFSEYSENNTTPS
ncbi:hypothetical protein [Sphingosinicella sp. LY1275]|uniref:hypothetical protein n=1 Tax=Sphingosinicella sp. LY1275 TaxID=3095379 RepID=UPI002ADEE6F2|nr:hypothetical protein [Sphingosinicella sp. LY1275]MEA1014815.1 hypothetical protein [Sphingosinicella sp. LY1275]